MTDRVEALGGTIPVTSPSGQGTTPLVVLPVEVRYRRHKFEPTVLPAGEAGFRGPRVPEDQQPGYQGYEKLG